MYPPIRYPSAANLAAPSFDRTPFHLEVCRGPTCVRAQVPRSGLAYFVGGALCALTVVGIVPLGLGAIGTGAAVMLGLSARR